MNKKFGERKGYLGKETTEAPEIWIRKQTQGEITHDALALLETGYHPGRHRFKDRKDLCDRANGSY